MKKVYTTGRPPWYDHRGIKCPLVIGVAGMINDTIPSLNSGLHVWQVVVLVGRQAYAGMPIACFIVLEKDYLHNEIKENHFGSECKVGGDHLTRLLLQRTSPRH